MTAPTAPTTGPGEPTGANAVHFSYLRRRRRTSGQQGIYRQVSANFHADEGTGQGRPLADLAANPTPREGTPDPYAAGIAEPFRFKPPRTGRKATRSRAPASRTPTASATLLPPRAIPTSRPTRLSSVQPLRFDAARGERRTSPPPTGRRPGKETDQRRRAAFEAREAQAMTTARQGGDADEGKPGKQDS